MRACIATSGDDHRQRAGRNHPKVSAPRVDRTDGGAIPEEACYARLTFTVFCVRAAWSTASHTYCVPSAWRKSG